MIDKKIMVLKKCFVMFFLVLTNYNLIFSQVDKLDLKNGDDIKIHLTADNNESSYFLNRLAINADNVSEWANGEIFYIAPFGHGKTGKFVQDIKPGLHVNMFGHLGIGMTQDDENYILSMAYSTPGALKTALCNDDDTTCESSGAFYNAFIDGRSKQASFGIYSINNTLWPGRTIIETDYDVPDCDGVVNNSTGIVLASRDPNSEISFIVGTGACGSEDETMTIKKNNVKVKGALSVSKTIDISYNNYNNGIINVKDVSAIRLVSGAGAFSIYGFSEGEEGQILYVFYGGPNNQVKIHHDYPHSNNQRIILGKKKDIVFEGSHGGGMTLRCFSKVWYEVASAY